MTLHTLHFSRRRMKSWEIAEWTKALPVPTWICVFNFRQPSKNMGVDAYVCKPSSRGERPADPWSLLASQPRHMLSLCIWFSERVCLMGIRPRVMVRDTQCLRWLHLWMWAFICMHYIHILHIKHILHTHTHTTYIRTGKRQTLRTHNLCPAWLKPGLGFWALNVLVYLWKQISSFYFNIVAHLNVTPRASNVPLCLM